MTPSGPHMAPDRPMVQSLGDSAILVRFGYRLEDAANRAALAFAAALADEPIAGIAEIVPSLVSVFLSYDPLRVDFATLRGEIQLRLSRQGATKPARTHKIDVRFGGADGPDLAEIAARVNLDAAAFIARHNAAPLRVLATGFAPGFVYCGFHDEALTVPRRTDVRAMVPAGSILFAAGQTAIAATDIPTGWHVIGRSDFRNFRADDTPPTLLAAGDEVIFAARPMAPAR